MLRMLVLYDSICLVYKINISRLALPAKLMIAMIAVIAIIIVPMIQLLKTMYHRNNANNVNSRTL